MRNKQWYWGLALTAALAVSVPAGAQQTKHQTQTQKQKQTTPSAAKPAPFDPCTGSGLPPSSQMAPFAPGSPTDMMPHKKKTYAGKVTCSNGKCKAEGTTPNNPYAQPGANRNAAPSLPLSPGATKAGKKNEAKEKNAFPLAQSEAAQAERQKVEHAPPPQQGAYSSSNQRLPGMNALGNGPAETPGALGQHPEYDPVLGKRDDKVGHFYLQRHDWAGAYGRYKEAAAVNPGDIKAVIGLAIAADHLGKREVAVRNYKLYLAVLPDGPHSKEALRALKRLDKKH